MGTPTPQSDETKSAASSFVELDLYRVFASCFSHPTRERFAWLTGKECQVLLKKLRRHFDPPSKHPPVGGFSSFPEYEAAYIALFEVGTPEPPVPLIESAHCHRVAPQEIVLECVNFYDVLGLRPAGSSFPPDHLVTQLEFLAAVRYLRENDTNPGKAEALRLLQYDFIERHLLNWLPLAQEKLEEVNPPRFPSLLRLLTAYLKEESRMVGTGPPARPPLSRSR